MNNKPHIGYALNYLLDNANDDGCQWLACFDQDSYLDSDSMNQMIEYIQNKETNGVAVFAPEFIPENVGEVYSRLTR
ncbi:MAG: glycosyltransferase [Lachnospiraceae bacterium]|nr:glycosyltransferase [Lachnospiraceae bacterium]